MVNEMAGTTFFITQNVQLCCFGLRYCDCGDGTRTSDLFSEFYVVRWVVLKALFGLMWLLLNITAPVITNSADIAYESCDVPKLMRIL